MEKKKVLLIGDSIRMGYDKYVKNYLSDSCEVYYPKDNCRFAQYTLRHLSDWKSGFNGEDLDLIHWNVGLWDTLELYDDGCLTPPEFYAFFIEKICKRIKVLFPKAKVIFATSTPVIESRFTEPHFSRRLNSNVKKYNNIAVEICKNFVAALRSRNDSRPVILPVSENIDFSVYETLLSGGEINAAAINIQNQNLQQYTELCNKLNIQLIKFRKEF